MRLRWFLACLMTALIGLSCAATIQLERHKRLKCSSCHEGTPEKGRPSFKDRENPSETCKDCHKYFAAGDHHPSDPDVELFGDKCAEVAPMFPLVDGKMECLTCHQMHAEEVNYSGTKYFLRGGPYQERREICFKCHRKEFYTEFNPHEEMIEKKKGADELKTSTCLACHAEKPDPRVDTEKTVKFQASVAFLCWRCHPPMIAEFMDQHFLKKPSEKILESMAKGSMEHQVILPLDFKGRLTCSTCHNPHQPGVMYRNWAKKGEGASKRLRDSNICVICHQINF